MDGSTQRPGGRRFRRGLGLVWLWLCCLTAVAPAQERREGSNTLVDRNRTVIELQTDEGEETQDEPTSTAGPDVMIGMEAFREVLQTGEYLVGPGDRFLVHVSDMEEPIETKVLAEGGLFLPRIGRVAVGGLRLSEARAAVDSAFARTVKVGRIYVELLAPRRFPVSVVGLVNRPGVVTASGVERVSEVLQRAGGVAERASERNIVVLRSGDLTPAELARLQRDTPDMDALLHAAGARRVDLTLFDVTGHSPHNPFIQDGDVVVVPSRQYVLRAMEAVRRPDTYEYVPGDRLSTLVTLAMGPTGQYDPDNVMIFRYVGDGTRQEYLPVDLEGALAGNGEADILLQPGDWLVARSLPEFQRETTVRLIGEIAYPGFYVVGNEGRALSDVLAEAGGVTDEASLPKARVVRRVDENEDRDPEFDRILTIPPAAWTEEEKQYFNMRSREKRGQLVVDFVALFEDGDRQQDILLRPGDVVVIPKSQRTVLVSGQAAYPGAVPHVEGFGVSDYIERAGGFGWRASDDVRVIKARTGEIRSADEVDTIEPGDNIWIKEEPVRDYWAIFTQSVQVAGQVATVLLLFVTVLQ
jgi:protein involved in polysaccharide export with SLBB domain